MDQLSAEQRAIVELVVQRGRSYDELADVLGMEASRVRELAREALVALAPRSAGRVDADRLGQIADYVLGQQSPAEQTATKTHLRRSEAGRAWTSSLVDSLDGMYPGPAPEIPEGEAEAPPRRRRERPREREQPRGAGVAPEPPREPSRAREPLRRPPRAREREPLRRPAALSPEAAAAVRRRRLIGAGLGALAIALVIVGIVVLTGGDDNKKTAKPTARAQPRILGELLLRPVGGGKSGNQGIAILAERSGERDLIVQAKLPPTKRGQAYEVWLYNGRRNAVPVGAQVTDQNGNYQGAGKLPADLSRFKAIDVSLQQIPNPTCQRNPACLKRLSAHSGNSVLRGLVSAMRAPSQTGTSPTTPGTTTAP